MGDGNIEYVRYYKCGSCTNNENLVFNFKKENAKRDGHKSGHGKKEFNAGVFLIKHRTYGYVLYDTGYSTDILRCGIKGKLYNILNPISIRPEDEISVQLEKDGISVDDINYIVLSHMHPDHIGGLKYFRNCKRILISKAEYSLYTEGKLSSLIFNKLVPDWFDRKYQTISHKSFDTEVNGVGGYFDLFRDRSMLLKMLPGHTKGQMGALINKKLFIGADASWGTEYLDNSIELKPIGRLIQSDMQAYNQTTEVLKEIKSTGVRLVFSHDAIPNRTELLKNV